MTVRRFTFPQPPRGTPIESPREWLTWANMMTRIMEQYELFTAHPASTNKYSVSNLTTDREYDADSTTTAELADVLGTLITDLKAKGVIE